MKLAIAVVVIALLGLSLASELATSPFIGIVAASLDTSNDFALMSFAANGKATMITNLTTVGGILPMESAYVAHLDAVAFLSIGVKSGCGLVKSDGTVLGNWTFPNVVLTNIQYDLTLKAMYLVGYVPTERKNYLWQLFENGTLSKVVALPGIVQLSISTYCQKSHTFFATVQTNSNSMNALIIIDTQGKKVTGPINLDDSVEMLFWDYTAAVMYSMIATETQAGVLVTLDINTGKRLKMIAAFTNLSSNPNNGAAAAFNIKTKVITGAFITDDSALTPYWVTIDTQSGKTTNVQYPYGYAINVLVNSPQ